jgi:hypothetical protein
MAMLRWRKRSLSVAWAQYSRLGVGRSLGASFLHGAREMGDGKWEKELACNIKELQNSIGTSSSNRSFDASDYIYSFSFHS